MWFLSVYLMIIAVAVIVAGVMVESQWIVVVTARLGICQAVWTQDYDGDYRIKWLRRAPGDGALWCHRIGNVGTCILLPNGEIQQPNYAVKWGYYHPAKGRKS